MRIASQPDVPIHGNGLGKMTPTSTARNAASAVADPEHTYLSPCIVPFLPIAPRLTQVPPCE